MKSTNSGQSVDAWHYSATLTREPTSSVKWWATGALFSCLNFPGSSDWQSQRQFHHARGLQQLPYSWDIPWDYSLYPSSHCFAFSSPWDTCRAVTKAWMNHLLVPTTLPSTSGQKPKIELGSSAGLTKLCCKSTVRTRPVMPIHSPSEER